MNDTQHGFTARRSTFTQLIKYYTDILQILEKHQNVDAIYLDFAKAFDKCDHGVTLHKLKSLGICGKLGVWIHAFLTKRQQVVCVLGKTSSVKWVLSGINAGGNMGVDSYISGTVAAVREAAMHGIQGIAVSQYKKKGLEYNWDNSTKWTAKLLTDLFNRPLPPGDFWNVNLPHLPPEAGEPEVVFCRPCNKPLPVNYRTEGDKFYYVGKYSSRERTPGSDVDVCFSGKIAVTQLSINN